MPERFREFDVELILGEKRRSSDERRLIKQFLAKPRGFLIFQGTTGRGKTTAACAVTEEIIRMHIEKQRSMSGSSPVFYTYNKLLREFSDMDVSGRSYDRAVGASILVLDDVGAGNVGLTQFQERMFWSLLKERDETPSKITIITTNIPLIQSNDQDGISLRDLMGTAMWDRMENSMIPVTVSGESFREEQ